MHIFLSLVGLFIFDVQSFGDIGCGDGCLRSHIMALRLWCSQRQYIHLECTAMCLSRSDDPVTQVNQKTLLCAISFRNYFLFNETLQKKCTYSWTRGRVETMASSFAEP